MAEYDKEDGRPGFLGPDLDALDEDLLSADLEADLDGDIGEEARDEGGLGDSGDTGLDGEFEDSDDDKDLGQRIAVRARPDPPPEVRGPHA